MKALPCIKCAKQLENVDGLDGNQPYAGTTFISHGHYGSTVFDPMNSDFIEINLCDDCIREAAKKGQILKGKPQPAPAPQYQVWRVQDEN